MYRLYLSVNVAKYLLPLIEGMGKGPQMSVWMCDPSFAVRSLCL